MTPVDTLLSILDLERLEVNLFRGHSPLVGWKRVYGGQVVAQALVAANRTVEGRRPHSLHCYFLLGGDPSIPIIYEVERIRDGRSFTTRRVVAIQKGEAIFAMSASYHAESPDCTTRQPCRRCRDRMTCPARQTSRNSISTPSRPAARPIGGASARSRCVRWTPPASSTGATRQPSITSGSARPGPAG